MFGVDEGEWANGTQGLIAIDIAMAETLRYYAECVSFYRQLCQIFATTKM